MGLLVVTLRPWTEVAAIVVKFVEALVVSDVVDTVRVLLVDTVVVFVTPSKVSTVIASPAAALLPEFSAQVSTVVEVTPHPPMTPLASDTVRRNR